MNSHKDNIRVDVIIIGAGAAGLMCAIEAGKRGRSVLVVDHANKPGKKILMSGGGRCNFTNYHVSPDKFISHNKHFCKSALSSYTQWDFINLVEKYKIKYHEKTLGQLFCDDKSKQIVEMLLTECELYKVKTALETNVISVIKVDNSNTDSNTDKDSKFKLTLSHNNTNINYICESLVIATGGLSIPTMGATGFAYNLAKQFGLNIYPTKAGLVPLTLQPADLEIYSKLSGVSCNSIVQSNNKIFKEDFLFTHRGISGPAVLQISNYWSPGEFLSINLCPDININLDSNFKEFTDLKTKYAEMLLKNFVIEYFNVIKSLNLPKRLILIFLEKFTTLGIGDQKLKSLSVKVIAELLNNFANWQIKPNGTEGYRTAEVTLGGVDCDELSSKTMEVRKVPGLFFIGECLDVTGWLGGYNFQWAWSSGYAAGKYV